MRYIFNFSKGHWASAFLLICFFSILGNKAFAQETARITVSGTVSDTLGRSIPGATIMVVGNTKTGTQTDPNGKFTIQVNEGAVLRITYIGYKEQRITVTSAARTFNIRLVENSMQANEVVITAMGQNNGKKP